MTRNFSPPTRRLLFAVAGLAQFLAVVVAGLIVWFSHRDLASARAPDGSWEVAVVGQPLLTGGVELYVQVRDGAGRTLPGAQVIGISPDWPTARKACGAASCVVTAAVVAGRTLQRKDYLGY